MSIEGTDINESEESFSENDIIDIHELRSFPPSRSAQTLYLVVRILSLY